MVIHDGDFRVGNQKHFFNAQDLSAGAYLLTLDLNNGQRWTEHLMIR